MMRWLLIAALCALSAAIACTGEAGAPPAQSPTQTFVGLVDGTDVRLALVRNGEAFQAYVCGRGDTLATHTRWFASTPSDVTTRVGADTPSGVTKRVGADALEAVTDAWRLRLASGSSAQADGALSGELETPGGDLLTWSATLARAGTEEGLYDASHAGCRAGIIVWQAEPGPACQAQGSWCDAQAQRGQVTPVVCAADEPLRVEGSAAGGTFELIAERVALP